MFSEGFYCPFISDALLSILLGLHEYNFTFMDKYANEQFKTGGQYCKELHCNTYLARRAYVNWDKSDPCRRKYQRAEGDQFGLIKIIWKLAG